MITTAAIFLLGVLLIVASKHKADGEFDKPILSMGLICAIVGAVGFMGKMANSHDDIKPIILAGLALIAGALIVWWMTNEFANSSPFSQSWGEYFLYGWFKWDNYAEIWLFGAALFIGAAFYLYSHSAQAVERIDRKARYSAALEEIHAQDRARLAQAKAHQPETKSHQLKSGSGARKSPSKPTVSRRTTHHTDRQ